MDSRFPSLNGPSIAESCEAWRCCFGLSGSWPLVEPRPFRRAVMSNGPAGRLADQACIFGKRPSPMPGWPPCPCVPSLRQFIVVDQQIHAARAGIDPDSVSFAHQRQRAADERFRTDIADAHSARRAEKPPVGDKRDLLSHPVPVNQCGNAQHLAHAGTADRTFITNDENLTRGIFAIANSIDAFFLILEHACVSFKYQLLEAGDLDNGAIRAEVALQNCQATVRHDRRTG